MSRPVTPSKPPSRRRSRRPAPSVVTRRTRTKRVEEIVLRLAPPVADAVLVIFDAARRVDRRRGMRLVEALSTLIAMPPRRRAR